MTEAELHRALVYVYFGLGAATLGFLSFVTAPYGRHKRGGYGRDVPQRLAWVLMEVPAVVVFAAIYGAGRSATDVAPLVMLALWQVHYVQRTFLFPLRLRPGKHTPSSVVASAIGFNVLNAYVNARWISELGTYPDAWLRDPRFLAGACLFVAGFVLNVHADGVLARLRGPGETGYKVPRGGLFELVSCPNYLAEILEWAGWALLTWSLGGVAFAFYTLANLAPRALAHHRWYRERFPEYPPGRRALVPFVL